MRLRGLCAAGVAHPEARRIWRKRATRASVGRWCTGRFRRRCRRVGRGGAGRERASRGARGARRVLAVARAAAERALELERIARRSGGRPVCRRCAMRWWSGACVGRRRVDAFVHGEQQFGRGRAGVRGARSRSAGRTARRAGPRSRRRPDRPHRHHGGPLARARDRLQDGPLPDGEQEETALQRPAVRGRGGAGAGATDGEAMFLRVTSRGMDVGGVAEDRVRPAGEGRGGSARTLARSAARRARAVEREDRAAAGLPVVVRELRRARSVPSSCGDADRRRRGAHVSAEPLPRSSRRSMRSSSRSGATSSSRRARVRGRRIG